MPYRRWNPGYPCCTGANLPLTTIKSIGGAAGSFGLYNSCFGFHTYDEWSSASGEVTITKNIAPPSGTFPLTFDAPIGIGFDYYFLYRNISRFAGDIPTNSILLTVHAGSVYRETTCNGPLNTINFQCELFLSSYRGAWVKSSCNSEIKIYNSQNWRCLNISSSPSIPLSGVSLTWDLHI